MSTSANYSSIFPTTLSTLSLLPGTAALPSLSFQGSPTTGFYRPAADQIGLSVSGALSILFQNDAFGGGAIVIPSELGGMQIGGSTADPGASGSTLTVASSFYSANYTANTAGAGLIPAFQTKASRGSLAVPTATQNNDGIGNNFYNGHNGTTYIKGAQFFGQATQTWTGSATGTSFFIDTTPNGSTGVVATMGVLNNGSLSLRRSSGANLIWETEGAGDIGAASANRPANIYATTSMHVNGSNASAVLEASSTTKGFLLPRMTTTQKLAISSPAQGLMVFDVTLVKLCVYNGSAWETITSV